MVQPYQPPAAEPLEPKEGEKPGKSKAAKAARIMAVGAMVVGGLLLGSFKGFEQTLADLLRDIHDPKMPRFIFEALRDPYTFAVGPGVIMACFAMAMVSFRKARFALVLALTAVVMIGGWAGMALYVIMKVIKGMAG